MLTKCKCQMEPCFPFFLYIETFLTVAIFTEIKETVSQESSPFMRRLISSKSWVALYRLEYLTTSFMSTMNWVSRVSTNLVSWSPAGSSISGRKWGPAATDHIHIFPCNRRLIGFAPVPFLFIVRYSTSLI
jgi:hypothetical protein